MANPYAPYLHLVIMVAIAVVFAGAFVLLSRLVGPRRPLPEKLTTYETGVKAEGVFLGRFNVKFFTVAILFLLFDLEVVFLYPGALALRDLVYPTALRIGELQWRGLIEVLVFLAILLVGWAFVIGAGVLDWGTPRPPWHRRGQATVEAGDDRGEQQS